MTITPAPATEQEWLGNATGPARSGAMDNMASDYLQQATDYQNNGNRTAALAAAQSALIALVAADAIDAGRGVAL
ncbi:hypothetical protein [Pseudarthrobacter polychromogenes]|uniref:Uncharacterized protein n=1 Tax=Pseudarthrobacter polychromogenes TaxID=1676 RepID=A0ABQ1Y383_9MICC|nr:hypothetical protein [Pseudarthrobacter polychromogenes]GGH10157.1 hypothetical protein GCM10011577_38890 [Pseudarthrobacter polychromogenes]